MHRGQLCSLKSPVGKEFIFDSFFSAKVGILHKTNKNISTKITDYEKRATYAAIGSQIAIYLGKSMDVTVKRS